MIIIESFVVILCLLGNIVCGKELPVYASETEEIKQLEAERQQALEMIEELKSSITSVQKDIEHLTIEKNNIQSYINSLDTQMSIVTNEISDFENEIEEKIASIKETKKSLEQAKEVCEQQYEAMKLRIRYMYENGNTDYFQILLESQSISDFLIKAEYILQLSEYDRDKL